MASDNPGFISNEDSNNIYSSENQACDVTTSDEILTADVDPSPKCEQKIKDENSRISGYQPGKKLSVSDISINDSDDPNCISKTDQDNFKLDNDTAENNSPKSDGLLHLGNNIVLKENFQVSLRSREDNVTPNEDICSPENIPTVKCISSSDKFSGNDLNGGSNEPLYPAGEERRMLRNVMMIGVVFMMHFTASLGVTHLQSSVNAAQGLGTSALAAQYVGLVLSSLVLTVFLINKLGCKWTIVVAITANMPYMAAQIYPRVYTLVPAAFLMGLGVAPLWSAKCTYLCVIAEAHSQFTGTALKTIRDKVIGIFFMIFLLSMVWGNLVSSVVLSFDEGEHAGNLSLKGLCGVNFCPGSVEATSNPNLERPSQEKISIIIGIYLACMVLACLVAALGVDSLKRYKEGQRTNSASGLSTIRLLTVTMELHRKKEMLLMIPLSIWLGVDYAFVEAEYTASFVACAWGIRHIGYVIVCYGLANSGLALVTGWIVARAGRRPVLCVVALLHAILLASLHAWQPSPDDTAVFFVVAALLGAADGHWCVQINSLYAILFPGKEEAAYSNFRLWQSVGFIIAFSYSHYLCTSAKLYVVIALLVVGVAGYLLIELSRSRKVALLS